MVIGEAEQDFEYSGNIQSDIYNPKYSNGRVVTLDVGSMKTWFDIIHAGKYSLRVKLAKEVNYSESFPGLFQNHLSKNQTVQKKLDHSILQ